MAELSVIIVTYNSAGEIGACLESLSSELSGLDAEVYVVDNASRDETRAIVCERFPWVRFHPNADNAGFPAANNQAIISASGTFLLLLNPDTVVPRGAIEGLLRVAKSDRKAGILGPTLVDAAGKVAPDLWRPTLLRTALRMVPSLGLDRFFGTKGTVEVLSGAALFVRREVFETIGLLDERLFWREDVDFCFRALKAGFGVRKVTEFQILHLEGRSAASNVELAIEKPIASQIAFFVKHHGKWAALAESGLLAAQTLLRLMKWSVLHALRPSPQSATRRRALATVLGRLAAMRYLRGAIRIYGAASSTGQTGERRLRTDRG